MTVNDFFTLTMAFSMLGLTIGLLVFLYMLYKAVTK
jgi:hypothetical protein